MHTWIDLSKHGAKLILETSGARRFVLQGLGEGSAEMNLAVEKLGFKEEDGSLVCKDLSLSFNRFQAVFPKAELTGMVPEQFVQDFPAPTKEERLSFEDIEARIQSKKPQEGRRKPKSN